MHSFICYQTFTSSEKAYGDTCHFCSVRTKTIGSLQSARISVPPLFIKEEEEKDDKLRYKWRTNLIATQPYWEGELAIGLDNILITMLKKVPYYNFFSAGWFKQLSSSFLSQRCAKLLVLAGAESLDKDLMIGQMQGKYQLTVFQDVGHCLQEEAPRRLGVVLLEFWKRNLGARDQARILKNVKKVGQS
jgi:protein phosphatase methylesterase 1